MMEVSKKRLLKYTCQEEACNERTARESVLHSTISLYDFLANTSLLYLRYWLNVLLFTSFCLHVHVWIHHLLLSIPRHDVLSWRTWPASTWSFISGLDCHSFDGKNAEEMQIEKELERLKTWVENRLPWTKKTAAVDDEDTRCDTKHITDSKLHFFFTADLP